MENGKLLAQSEGELSMAADHLRWFAEAMTRDLNRMFRLSSQIEVGTLGITMTPPA